MSENKGTQENGAVGSNLSDLLGREFNTKPGVGDRFFINLPAHEFHCPESLAAHLSEEACSESAALWADHYDGDPWLVIECRVVRRYGNPA